MNDQIGVWIGIAFGVANFIGLIYFVAIKQARVESRVEIMWAFLLRRGVMEALSQGVMTHQSPLAIPPEILQKYDDLFGKMRAFYRDLGTKMSDVDLLVALEERFWTDIAKICVEQKLRAGACLAMLVFHVRPNAAIFKQFEAIDLGDVKVQEGV